MDMKYIENLKDLIIYQSQNNENISVEVLFNEEDFWLTQKSMSKLFNVSENNITYHLQNIFKTKELEQDSVTQKIGVTASDGKKYNTKSRLVLNITNLQFIWLFRKKIYINWLSSRSLVQYYHTIFCTPASNIEQGNINVTYKQSKESVNWQNGGKENESYKIKEVFKISEIQKDVFEKCKRDYQKLC